MQNLNWSMEIYFPIIWKYIYQSADCISWQLNNKEKIASALFRIFFRSLFFRLFLILVGTEIKILAGVVLSILTTCKDNWNLVLKRATV